MGNKELCEAALKEIEEARKKGWNVLTADMTITGLSDWHVPVVETVMLDPDPKAGDIYIQKGNDEDAAKQRYAVTRQGLSKLAVAAAIIWSATETRRTDNRSDRDYVSFQAVGGLKKPDGTYAFMKAEYDLDFEVVAEELQATHEAAAKKWKKGPDYVDFCFKRDMIQKRKNKLKLAESGAKDRVIRELLGIKATYPLPQIKNPFVILRITVRPDYSDKEVKRAMLAAAINSMTGIYGGSAPAQIPYDEPIDVTPEPSAPPPPADPPPSAPPSGTAPAAGTTPSPTEETKQPDAIESQVMDFTACEAADQVKAIESLAKRKGYDAAAYLVKSKRTSLLEFKPEKRIEFFKYLLSLPEDVPFP